MVKPWSVCHGFWEKGSRVRSWPHSPLCKSSIHVTLYLDGVLRQHRTLGPGTGRTGVAFLAGLHSRVHSCFLAWDCRASFQASCSSPSWLLLLLLLLPPFPLPLSSFSSSLFFSLFCWFLLTILQASIIIHNTLSHENWQDPTKTFQTVKTGNGWQGNLLKILFDWTGLIA